jgi:hypothetical protein
MCDYSLELVASRRAKIGDELVTTKFQYSMTRGFAAIGEPNVAVCLLPGTEVAFKKEVKYERFFALFPSMKFGTLGKKVAQFRQINMGKRGVHRDALEFPRGDRAAYPAVRRPTCNRAAVASFSAPCECCGGAKERFTGQLIALPTIELVWLSA